MPPCPNCSLAAEEEILACPRCGYRPELAREYLWIYLGGCGVVFLGFVVGAVGIACEGVGPRHWSHVFHGWYPLFPWPANYTWLGFLLVGIVLTGCGLGITRQKRPACIGLAGLGAYESTLSGLALVGVLENSAAATAAAMTLVIAIALTLLACRLGLAFRRTPARNFSVRQETVSN